MLGRERLMEQAGQVLGWVEADGAEVTLQRRDAALTRYANSIIHQNVTHEDLQLSLRAVVEDGQGWAECNQLDEASVRIAASLARQQALANRGTDATLMATPQEYRDVPTYYLSTQNFDAAARAEMVATICRCAREQGLSAAGFVQREVVETVMMNTQGLVAYQGVSDADVMAIISNSEGSGFSRRVSRDAAAIDVSCLAQEAVERCRRNQGARSLDSGCYPVVLEPYAAGELFMALAAMALGAGEVQQGSSFMATSFGEQLLHPSVTLWDDACDATGLPVQFDGEGVAKRRVELIWKGKPIGPVHDLTTAERAGIQSTGHASFRGDGLPYASNLFVKEGSASTEQLVGQIDYGLLITRFHYLALVHPGQTRWSGMTRDGTFLIEGGKVTSAVRNLRFDDRILDQLKGAVQVASDARLVRGFPGCIRVPALALERFNFTGSTL